MEPSPIHPPGTASPLAPPVRSRPWLHVFLFASTFLSLAVCWAFLFEGVAPWRIDVGLAYALPVLAILGAHEMGHYVACRIHGVRASLPYFLPGVPLGTFGAVIRIRERIPDRRALFDIAAAGPIAGFVVALPVFVHGIATAQWTPPPSVDAPPLPSFHFGASLLSTALRTWLHPPSGTLSVGPTYIAAWFGMLVTSINLFPVGQLDGGHAVFAISRRLHRYLAWGTILGMSTWVAATMIVRMEPSPYLVWCVVLLFLRARHPPLLNPYVSLGRTRRWVAVLLLLLFVITFMPVPLRVV
jgi:membrane-associated protease RseP (regulator of RpoE activity)